MQKMPCNILCFFVCNSHKKYPGSVIDNSCPPNCFSKRQAHPSLHSVCSCTCKHLIFPLNMVWIRQYLKNILPKHHGIKFFVYILPACFQSICSDLSFFVCNKS